MNMKTIIALIMSVLVSQAALADGSNYVKLPDYDPNSGTATPTYDDSYGEDSYGADTSGEAAKDSYGDEAPPNYVENAPDSAYSDTNGWGQVKAACDKRENDPYRISGQLSPLRIQIICTQYSSIDARIQAKGMDTYSVRSQPVRVHRWKKDVLCEDLAHSGYDLNVLCGQSSDTSNYDENATYEDTEGQGS